MSEVIDSVESRNGESEGMVRKCAYEHGIISLPSLGATLSLPIVSLRFFYSCRCGCHAHIPHHNQRHDVIRQVELSLLRFVGNKSCHNPHSSNKQESTPRQTSSSLR